MQVCVRACINKMAVTQSQKCNTNKKDEKIKCEKEKYPEAFTE